MPPWPVITSYSIHYTKLYEAEDEHYVKLAVDSGMEYFELTDEQLAPIVEKVRAEVWPQMEPDVGKDIMDLIRAQVK